MFFPSHKKFHNVETFYTIFNMTGWRGGVFQHWPGGRESGSANCTLALPCVLASHTTSLVGSSLELVAS